MPRDHAKLISTGYQPHKHQTDVHAMLALYRYAVLVCHRRFGKTVLAINALCDAALRCEKPHGRFIYVAPYLKQAKQIAWLYLVAFAATIPGSRKNESELYVEFPGGHRVTLYGADNAEAIRGTYIDGCVGDEVADWAPHIWGSIIRPAMSDRKGWVLFIGTPKGVNVFSELYEYAQGHPDWFAAVYRADETDLPWLDSDELEACRDTMSDAQYRQEYLCDFNASSDNTLITIDIVSECCARDIPVFASLDGLPKIMGVDVARFGDDNSVITLRHGHYVAPQIVCKGVDNGGLDNMQLVGRIAQEIVLFDPDAVFIDGGRGEGVIDRLRQLGHDNIIEVQFGGKAPNPHYANMRSYMWDTMREGMLDGLCLPNDRELKGELCAPTYKFNASNKMLLESKEDIKERLNWSPDRADSLALTFAAPVMPRKQKQYRGLVHKADIVDRRGNHGGQRPRFQPGSRLKR